MARYQKGQVHLRGRNKDVWYGRFREDVQQLDGSIKRVNRNIPLGTIEELPTKRAARRALDQNLDKVNSLDYRPKKLTTFRQFVKVWEETTLTQKKPGTQVTDLSVVRKHLLPFFGDRLLSDITPMVVQQFISSRKGYSPATIKSVYGVFRGIMKVARLWGEIDHDPFPRGAIALPKRSLTTRKPFTEEEIHRIIEAAEEPDKTLYRLLVETGLRIDEALALDHTCLDLEDGLIIVQQNISRTKLVTTKTEAGERVVALGPELREHLRQRFAGRTGWLFPPKRSALPSYSAALDRLHALLDRLGIERRGFHCFRYTTATVAVAEGADVKTLQNRLGHKDPALTLKLYARQVSAGERALAAKMSAKFAPKLHPSAVA